MQKKIINFRQHSPHYSGLYSLNEIAEFLRKDGQKFFPLLYRGGLSEMVQHHKTAAAYGLKPISAVELPLSVKSLEIDSTVLLVIQNETGYQNVCRLLAENEKNGVLNNGLFNGKVSFQSGKTDGLVALLGGTDGLIYQLYKTYGEEAKKSCLNYALGMKDLFKGRCFIELQKGSHADLKGYNEFAKTLANETGIPVIASHDAYFLMRGKEDYEQYQQSLLARKTDVKVSKNVLRTNCLMPSSILSKAFAGEDAAIDNTVSLANSIEGWDFKRAPILPSLANVASGGDVMLQSLAEDRLKQRVISVVDSIKGGRDISSLPHQKQLLKLVHELDSGVAIEKTSFWGQYQDRLNSEMNVIKEKGLSDYFLIVSDYVDFCHRENIAVGAGRGSAAGSLVAYALGITEVDPMAYNLLFERFLNPERNKLPDIDIDFQSDRRNEVIEYITQKYGNNHVAAISVWTTFQPKGAIEAAGAAYGLLAKSEVVRNLKHSLDLVEGGSLLSKWESYCEQTEREATDVEMDIAKLSDRLVGKIMNRSLHPAGVAIVPNNVTEHFPTFLNPKTGGHVIAFDKDDAESMGVVKFDLLSSIELTVIQKTLENIRLTTGQAIKMADFHQINFYDKEVYKHIFQSGNLRDVFQSDSSYATQLLMNKLQPETLEELALATSLARPSSKMAAERVVDIKQGRAETELFGNQLKTSFPDDLTKMLTETYGVIVYQEQSMKLCLDYGNLSVTDAERLRKAIEANDFVVIDELKDKFVSGAVNGSEWADAELAEQRKKDAEIIFKEITQESFNEDTGVRTCGGYGFNKSHALVYATMMFQTAWLKHYYPEQYFAAVLTQHMANSGMTETNISLLDATRNGCEILGVDINRSSNDFGLTKTENGWGITLPLNLKSVGKRDLENLATLKEMAGGEFKNFNHLQSIMNATGIQVSKTALDVWISAGAFVNTDGWHEGFMLDETTNNQGVELSSKDKEELSGINSVLGLMALSNGYQPEFLLGKREEILNQAEPQNDLNQVVANPHDGLTASEIIENLYVGTGLLPTQQALKRAVDDWLKGFGRIEVDGKPLSEVFAKLESSKSLVLNSNNSYESEKLLSWGVILDTPRKAGRHKTFNACLFGIDENGKPSFEITDVGIYDKEIGDSKLPLNTPCVLSLSMRKNAIGDGVSYTAEDVYRVGDFLREIGDVSLSGNIADIAQYRCSPEAPEAVYIRMGDENLHIRLNENSIAGIANAAGLSIQIEPKPFVINGQGVVTPSRINGNFKEQQTTAELAKEFYGVPVLAGILNGNNVSLTQDEIYGQQTRLIDGSHLFVGKILDIKSFDKNAKLMVAGLNDEPIEFFTKSHLSESIGVGSNVVLRFELSKRNNGRNYVSVSNLYSEEDLREIGLSHVHVQQADFDRLSSKFQGIEAPEAAKVVRITSGDKEIKIPVSAIEADIESMLLSGAAVLPLQPNSLPTRNELGDWVQPRSVLFNAAIESLGKMYQPTVSLTEVLNFNVGLGNTQSFDCAVLVDDIQDFTKPDAKRHSYKMQVSDAGSESSMWFNPNLGKSLDEIPKGNIAYLRITKKEYIDKNTEMPKTQLFVNDVMTPVQFYCSELSGISVVANKEQMDGVRKMVSDTVSTNKGRAAQICIVETSDGESINLPVNITPNLLKHFKASGMKVKPSRSKGQNRRVVLTSEQMTDIDRKLSESLQSQQERLKLQGLSHE